MMKIIQSQEKCGDTIEIRCNKVEHLQSKVARRDNPTADDMLRQGQHLDQLTEDPWHCSFKSLERKTIKCKSTKQELLKDEIESGEWRGSTMGCDGNRKCG
jgi:hypothetical protein